ncbi:MAG: P-II family nitrogen regulator [Faecousia sp.]
MKTNEHEVIFAIVNSGFAEDVMEVAREQGVRGGTILNARGVVREDAAAFFGITLHADKEILMMVVERSIRDRVLNAIYKEMGMAKKAKGIAFSLPVSDVAGLTPAPEPKEAQQAVEN